MGTENRALVGDALELVVVGVGRYLDRIVPDPDSPDDAGENGTERDLVSMLGVLVCAPAAPEGEATAQAIAGYSRELLAVWDAWARIRPFDAAETYRALDTAARLLEVVDADDEAAVVRELATVPLALFAARVLAEYVVDEPARGVASTAYAAAVGDDAPTADNAPTLDDAPTAEDAETPDGSQPDDASPDHVLTHDAVASEESQAHPVRLRAVNSARQAERIDDANAPASVRALRAVDPALPLVTWSELSDTITALLATGRLDPQVLAGFTRRTLDERARSAVAGARERGLSIRAEHVAWVIFVIRTRYSGTARVTRAAATALVAEYITDLAPRAGVDPRRVRQDMMAWVDVERA